MVQEIVQVHFNEVPDLFDGRPRNEGSFAVFIFRQSSGRYTVDFNEYTIQANSIVIISKDQQVSFNLSEEPQQFISLVFPPDFIKNAHEDVLRMFSFCIREHFNGKQILKLEDQDYRYLERLSYQLQEINLTLNSGILSLSGFHLLQLILIYCADLYSRQSVNKTTGYMEVVGNFTALLESNFRNIQKVGFYTSNLNLTYNSLARYTNQYCNKTPKEIITERLVLEIKRLLAATNIPVKEISYSLGFDEPTNMVKYFKKNTGITPSEFRNRSKNYHTL